MPRNRLLKREFFRSEKVGKLSLGARLLFQSLWCEADDSGNGRADARLLKSNCFAYDDFTAAQVEEWLQEITALRMVRLYEVDGARYYCVVNFLEHQKIDRPSIFRYPAPTPLDDGSSSTRRTLDECSSTKVKEKGNEKTKGKVNRSADALSPDRDFENLKAENRDCRFATVKKFYAAEFKKRNVGVTPPFNGSDAKALRDLLIEQRDAAAEKITSWLLNAFESGDTPPLRPGFRLREFCAHATKYTRGPLQQGKPTDRASAESIGDLNGIAL